MHNIRATGSYIRGTNGTSNGIVPMLRVFNDTGARRLAGPRLLRAARASCLWVRRSAAAAQQLGRPPATAVPHCSQRRSPLRGPGGRQAQGRVRHVLRALARRHLRLAVSAAPSHPARPAAAADSAWRRLACRWRAPPLTCRSLAPPLSCHPPHRDLRKNHGKEEARARDLFYALWIPDEFMRRVEVRARPLLWPKRAMWRLHSDAALCGCMSRALALWPAHSPVHAQPPSPAAQANADWSLFCPNEAPGLADCWGEVRPGAAWLCFQEACRCCG